MLVVRRRGDRNIERIQHEMEDLFHAMVSGGQPIRIRISAAPVRAWRPPIEVYETDSALVVLCEIAGLTEDQFEVVVDDSMLTIRGERLPITCEGRRLVHEMGIRYGAFEAEIYLPFSVSHDLITATYDNGLLRIELPRGVATRVQVRDTAR